MHTPGGMITLFCCVEISVAEISNTSRIPFLNILMLKFILRIDLHQFVDETFLNILKLLM